MALYGELLVNGDAVGEWCAQRLDDLLELDQVSLYLCWYVARNGPYYMDEPTYAVIEHRYSDGAAALASKVLQLAEGGWTS